MKQDKRRIENVSELFGIHQDVPAIIMGTGPSLAIIDELEFSGLRICTGDLPLRAPKYGPFDYWVQANSLWPRPWKSSDAKKISRVKVNKVVLATVAFANLETEETVSLIKSSSSRITNQEKLIYFDQRHFGNKYCEPKMGCCVASEMLLKEPPIQELLRIHLESNELPYLGRHSGAQHAYALAILMGCNPIYLAGIEIPLRQKNYKYINPYYLPANYYLVRELAIQAWQRFRARRSEPSIFGLATDEIVNDFRNLSLLAEKFGIATFCLSENSTLVTQDAVRFCPIEEIAGLRN